MGRGGEKKIARYALNFAASPQKNFFFPPRPILRKFLRTMALTNEFPYTTPIHFKKIS